MATYIKRVKDKNNNTIYPQTQTGAIFDTSGNLLQNVLDEKTSVVVSSSQPSNQRTNDIWYRIL